jgi:hypothetical protein
VQVTAAELVDLVLRAPGYEAVLDRLALPGEAGLVHPPGEALDIDH